MRVIKGISLFYFSILLLVPVFLALGAYRKVSATILDSFYGPMLGLMAGVTTFYCILVVTYRIYLRLFPFPGGELEPGSLGEERWKVYMAIWLIFLYPIILPRWIPVPLTGLLYRVLGARIGANSYFAGIIYDPHWVEIGHRVLGGAQSLIIPHMIERDRLGHYPIRIGNNVTIGAGAIILPGVTIEDEVLIGAGSVVSKNSVLRRGDVWAGNPARFIRNKFIDNLPTKSP